MSKKIVGHHKQRETLNRLSDQGHLPSALIFSGPNSTGKFLVALELIQRIICTSKQDLSIPLGGCDQCKNCQLLASSNYPDLHILDCNQEDDRSMDKIRVTLNSLLMKSYSGFARILLIRDADKISTSAANLLLKAIEESRDNSYFILVTANLSKLPNTVRSRSQVINFNPLNSSELEVIIPELLKGTSNALPTSSTWKNTGNVNAALQSLESKDQLSQLEEYFELLTTGDQVSALKIANLIHSDKTQASTQLACLVELSYLKMKKYPQNLRAYALLLENLLTAERYISQRYLNSQYILTNILLNFCELITTKNNTSLNEKVLSEILQD